MSKELLHKKKLKVRDQTDHSWIYTLAYTRKKPLPYYIAPREMQELHKTTYMDEAIFLPIEKSIFEKEKFTHHFGYRFLFGSNGFNIEDDMHKLKLTTEVCRIGYYIDDGYHDDIYIDYMGDGLFPPREFLLRGDPDTIQENTIKIILRVIDYYANWYVNKMI